MTATVVIPTRDKVDRLRLTLRALRLGGGAGEIVVVDDGTDPDIELITRQELAEFTVRVVRGRREGRAAARNTGAAVASGEVLIFLDDDILVGSGFVAAHLAAHAGVGLRRIAPGTSGCWSVVHGPLRELPRAARLVAAAPGDPHTEALSGTFGRTVGNALERLVLAMADGASPPLAPWLACVGANVSLPTALWRASGGFDEGFGLLWGCEDLEYGYRLHAGGATMSVAPAAAGVHLTHARPSRWEEHGVNFDRFLALHPDRAVAALPALLAADGNAARYVESVQSAPPVPIEGMGRP